jgi:hypothetical protein
MRSDGDQSSAAEKMEVVHAVPLRRRRSRRERMAAYLARRLNQRAMRPR